MVVARCIKNDGVLLTIGRDYDIISTGVGFIMVKNDNGEIKAYLDSYFELLQN